MAQGHSRRFALLRPGDVIGNGVADTDDGRIGYVRDLYFGQDDWRVGFLHVGTGGIAGLGDRHFLIPTEAVRLVSTGFVTVEPDREKVLESPRFDPSADRPDPQLERETYEYYGYQPPSQTDDG